MNKAMLQKYLNELDIICSDEQANKLEEFMNVTLETNEKFNLTAIKDQETFMEKMIFDSAIGLINNDLTNKKVIDVGTGAGFPGIVLKILQPTINLTLLDSTKKKIDHLDEYSKANKMNNICICDRAESYAKKNREKYDFAFARAVSSLPMLLELIIPMLKVGGCFVAMKGPNAEEEINESKNALKKLNCHIQQIYQCNLPESQEERNLVYIIKDKETIKKYPRDYSEIKSLPL